MMPAGRVYAHDSTLIPYPLLLMCDAFHILLAGFSLRSFRVQFVLMFNALHLLLYG